MHAFTENSTAVPASSSAMPYILPVGTRAKVIEPNGQIVETYVCQRHTSFSDGAMRRYGRTILNSAATAGD